MHTLAQHVLVPTLCVGMPSWPLRGLRAGWKTTQSVADGIPNSSIDCIQTGERQA